MPGIIDTVVLTPDPIDEFLTVLCGKERRNTMCFSLPLQLVYTGAICQYWTRVNCNSHELIVIVYATTGHELIVIHTS